MSVRSTHTARRLFPVKRWILIVQIGLRASYPTLSRSYRSVADYIMINQFDVAFMTATQLAAAVKVNTTTVVRFAQVLGYAGYPDMLEAIRQRVRAEVHAAPWGGVGGRLRAGGGGRGRRPRPVFAPGWRRSRRL